ncbi:MAG: hypothetical protein JXA46_14135 [Dehalococcoidales bacterium]|nr:hypothetical protein [Dehalococcoidales bacterium]
MPVPEEKSQDKILKKAGPAESKASPLESRSTDIRYACPYCAEGTAFDTAEALKEHIYNLHLWNNSSGNARIPIPLCMSIGGMETQEQVSKRVDEVAGRGLVCNLEMEEGILNDSYTRELADAGFEMELNWEGIEDLEDDYEAQKQFISSKKKALEDITGRPVLGGRRPHSHRDKYTYDICDALGFKWYHIRPSITCFPYQVTSPYRAQGHNFALCPRPPLHLWNQAGDVIPYKDAIDGEDYF